MRMTSSALCNLSYSREKIIGHGAFSTIFSGLWEGDKPVAIKRISRSLVVENGLKLRRELELMMKASHPNIVRIFSCEMDEDFILLGTELCAGTLQDVIENTYKGPKFENSREILCQITKGLAYLHDLNFVHRDIKPTNALIYITKNAEESAKPLIKLADFSLYRIFGVDRRVNNPNFTGPLGSEGWMAPELYQSNQFNFKVDIFSLGCIFAYAMTGGKHPFGDHPIKRSFMIMEKMSIILVPEDLEKPYSNNSSIAFELIHSLLDMEPEKRPTALQVLNHAFFYVNIFNEQGISHTEVEMDLDEEPANMQQIERGQHRSTVSSPNIKILSDRLSYDPTKLIGRGAFSNVYLGILEGTSGVAVKRIPKSETENNRAIFNEVDMLKDLSHPNIVKLICMQENEDFWFIVTELCLATLQDQIEGKYTGPAIADRKEILRQVTEGLAYLHENNIVHRDVKPTNILIFQTDVGVKPLMKFADFGISRMFSKPDRDFTNTDNTSPKGTRGWIAPELYQNHRCTSKVDIFSLGCVFGYTLSGGKHPFGNHPIERMLRIIRSESMVFNQQDLKEPYYNDGLAFELIECMVKNKPEERPTVNEVLNSLFFQTPERKLDELEPYTIYDHPSSPIPGLCVIICQNKFHNPKDDLDYNLDYSDTRYEGIGLDAKKLEETFKSFGYNVLSYKNLRADQITTLLTSRTLEHLANTSLKSYASLVVCLLGHGDKGVLQGVDGVSVSLNTIQYDAFNDQACPYLKGKPKIFIVLAFQGNKQKIIQNERWNYSASMDAAANADDEFMAVPFVDEEQSWAPINITPNPVQEILPPFYDFIRLISTIEEYKSRFSYGTGSVFIQSLCDALRNEYNEVVINPEVKEKNKRGLTQLFTELVIPTVGRLGGNIKQTPEFRSSLVKTIKFRLQKNHGTPLQREYNGETDDESFKYARRYREILLNNYAKKRIGYDILLKTVYGEASKEPEDIQRAIAWVIFNRYKKLYRPEWGVENMMRVCMATDQFKCWVNKKDIIMSDIATKNKIERWLPTAFDGGSLVDPTGGSTYFNKPAGEGFIGHLVQTVNIGSYQFYKDP